MSGGMRHGNKGFSLIEIIVAVLIVGIISATAIASVSTVHNARVSTAASVFGSVMQVTREKAMGLDNTTDADGISDVYLLLYIKNGNVYGDTYYGNEKLRSEKLSNDMVEVTFKNHKSSSASIALKNTTNKMVKIFFKKSTGGIGAIVQCDSVTDDSFDKYDDWIAHNSGSDFADTVVFEGPSEKKTVVISIATGRCYLDE